MDGLNYVCQSCDRRLFRYSVKFLKEKEVTDLKEKWPLDELTNLLQSASLEEKDPTILLCHNCLTTLKKKNTPKINVTNGLELDTVPMELQITDLEQQCIAKLLVFMKVAKMPRSGMPKIVDKVINVPIYDADIENTITSLPRMPSEASIVEVELKRKIEMKNTHAHAYIRPVATINAAKKLKDLKNPYYQNITINEKFEDQINTARGRVKPLLIETTFF